MQTNANVINWFEVPVTDFKRAKKFYETIFEIIIPEQKMGGYTMGFFPYQMGSGKLSGAIVQGEHRIPAKDGALIYFNANPDLGLPLGKIEKAGGKILVPKTQISPEIGFFAIFIDCEGNKLALHSQN